MSIAIALHLIAAVIWVGGMFFAYVVLRPAAGRLLEPPLRLELWSHVFRRFFPWVWASIGILIATGVWLMFIGITGIHVHIMATLAVVMIALFLHLNFAPVKRLHRAVIREDWADAGEQLDKIRQFVGINLCIGLLVLLIGSSGRYW